MPSEEGSMDFSDRLVMFTGIGFFGDGSSLNLNPRWQGCQKIVKRRWSTKEDEELR
jgi:hypothetical protein